MQRIFLSMLVVGGVVGAAIYGTTSFFSDSETSTGNTFTAGSVSLTIDDLTVDYNGDQNNAPKIVVNDDDNAFSFAIDDIKPLDNGTITYNLTNGANEAHVCALVTDATSAPEANDTALASMMNFLFGSESGTVSTAAGQWQSLGTMTPGELDALSVDYCFGVYDGTTCVLDESETYNDAQLGQMVVDLEFYAEQTRNNPSFTCDSLNEEQPVWVETNQASGSAVIVPVVGGPLGGTALQLTTINDVNSRVRYTYSPLNINLADFTSFSYDSNQVSAFDLVNGNASFRLIVDLDGVTTKDITFEPYYNIQTHNSLNDASIVPATWQNWAADPANGKFWASGVLSSGGGGAYATNFTINELLAAYPTAKITGMSVGMGTYNVDQVVLVDNVILNGTVYDL